MALFDTTRFIQDIYPLVTEVEKPDLCCRMVGELRSLGGFHWSQTISSGIVYTHILEGRGTLIKNGREFISRAGMTQVSGIGDQLEYFDVPEQPWRYIWLSLDGAKATSVWEQLTGGEDLPPRHLEQTGALASVKEALEKAKANDYGPYYSVSLAWSLIDRLGEELKGRGGGAAEFFLAKACAAYIDGHLLNAPAVEELSTRFKVSRVTIFRAFKREFGMSPKAYIEDLRFRKAARLLADIRLDIKEIAHQCGFKDQGHFSCRFREKFGASPRQWRTAR